MQHGDYLATRAIPEVNGIETVGARDPFAVRAVSQVPDRRSLRGQGGKTAAGNGVAQLEAIPALWPVSRPSHCNPFAIGAKGNRSAEPLPFSQDGDLLASNCVP